MRKKILVFGKVFVSLLLVVFVMIFTAGCFFEDDEKVVNNEIVYLNEVAKNRDGVEFVVTSIENTRRVGSGYLADTTENNFILLTIKVTNKGKKEQTIYNGCVALYNSNNVEYEDYLSFNIDDIELLGRDIAIGLTTTFQVLFEVPTNTDQSEYTIRIGYSSSTTDSDRVSIKLKKRDGSPTSSNSTSGGVINHAKKETFTFMGVEFKVISWGRSLYYCSDNKNNEFVDVTIQIRNVSNKTIDMDKFVFKLVYDNEIEYNCYGGYVYGSDYILTIGNLSPLETIDEGLAGFDIPKEAYYGNKMWQIKIYENYIYADEFHYVTLREEVIE